MNGQYVLALNHIDAVTFIRKLPNVAHMQVLRYSPSVEDKDNSNTGQVSFIYYDTEKNFIADGLGSHSSLYEDSGSHLLTFLFYLRM